MFQSCILFHMILTWPEMPFSQLICLGVSYWSFKTLFRHHVLLETFCNTLTTPRLAEQITFNSVLICTYFIAFSVLYFAYLFIYMPFSFFFLMFWFCWPRGMWDLSSLTRGRTRTPCIGRGSLNHWTAREVLPSFFK